jgi:hypothetical protein
MCWLLTNLGLRLWFFLTSQNSSPATNDNDWEIFKKHFLVYPPQTPDKVSIIQHVVDQVLRKKKKEANQLRGEKRRLGLNLTNSKLNNKGRIYKRFTEVARELKDTEETIQEAVTALKAAEETGLKVPGSFERYLP